MPVDSHVDSFSARLLGWYDRAARVLPWRTPPGSNVAADPYRVWLSEVMLQQTTVAAVIPYFERFTARWPTVEALAAADDAELMAAWAGLGYYARARNLLACARAVAAAGGFPDSEDGLRALPGVGPYTAAAIAAIAFDRPAAVVDGNIERVISRVFAIATPLPAAKPEIRTRVAEVTPTLRPGDFAQAMMDLGATVCTPRRPRCDDCPLASVCAAKAAGTPEAFPVKAAKRARPTKLGTVYWLEAAGSVLLVTRPARGLLGGMAALPTGPWTVEHPGLADAPAAVDWAVRPAAVRHGFTHFELVLD
ncbi:MAG: A/G-specific adenine glycosylase, partial [Alphaproteobacteria bacterium]|nr:A/G-specific adenine glycosylase [Alphaproteobacteria bacterium]